MTAERRDELTEEARRSAMQAFRMELRNQCSFALVAALDMNSSLQSHDTKRFWYSVDALLGAVGKVSKILWPSNELIPGRGKELREELHIGEDSPLRPRRMRNTFEHFDDRLERWALSSERHNIVDSNIMYPGAIQGLDPGDFLRNFDTTNNSITFRGDSFPVQPLVTAAEKLLGELAEPFAR